jgi:LuxR family quorum-sensing system transcriptional regulator SolR
MPWKRKPLSKREKEILEWLAWGKTAADIGTILGLSPRTVEWHTQRVMEKMGAINRTQAVAKAIKRGSILP